MKCYGVALFLTALPEAFAAAVPFVARHSEAEHIRARLVASFDESNGCDANRNSVLAYLGFLRDGLTTHETQIDDVEVLYKNLHDVRTAVDGVEHALDKAVCKVEPAHSILRRGKLWDSVKSKLGFGSKDEPQLPEQPSLEPDEDDDDDDDDDAYGVDLYDADIFALGRFTDEQIAEYEAACKENPEDCTSLYVKPKEAGSIVEENGAGISALSSSPSPSSSGDELQPEKQGLLFGLEDPADRPEMPPECVGNIYAPGCNLYTNFYYVYRNKVNDFFWRIYVHFRDLPPGHKLEDCPAGEVQVKYPIPRKGKKPKDTKKKKLVGKRATNIGLVAATVPVDLSCEKVRLFSEVLQRFVRGEVHPGVVDGQEILYGESARFGELENTLVSIYVGTTQEGSE